VGIGDVPVSVPEPGLGTRPLRVAHVAPCYWPAIEWGGPVQSIRLLAEAEAANGAKVEVFTTTSRASARWPRLPVGTVTLGRVTVHYGHAIGPRSLGLSPRVMLMLRRRVTEFDVIHVHGLWVAGTALAVRFARAACVPVVVSPRGTLDPVALAWRAWKKRAYMSLVESKTLSSASMVHFTTEGEQAKVPLELRKLPSCIVYNAVDVEPFRRIEPVARASGELRVLMVGRIHPIKGFDMFLPAIARARERGVKTSLRIAGPDEGQYRGVVERLVATCGLPDAVTWLGMVSREGLVDELRAADVLAQPSYTENFGMSCAEGMAAARPVLVSERVNLAPLVRQTRCGAVAPLTVEGLAGGLMELAQCPDLSEMGLRGRVAALDAFGPEAVGRQMLEVYSRLVSRRT